MRERYMKGLVHLALALAGLVELRNARTPARKLLTGGLVGWHSHSTFYHFILEKDKKTLDR